MADRRSVILKWVSGGGEVLLGGVVELVLVIAVAAVVVRARATFFNRDVGLI